MKKILPLLGAFGIAVMLTMLTPYMRPQPIEASISATLNINHAIIPQKVLETTKTEAEQNVIYFKNQIIGILNDENKLNNMLHDVYKDRYEADFPNTKLGLGEDIHTVKEVTFFTYEDKDAQILEYLNSNDLFSIETNKIEFSNGEALYVNNVEDFTLAKDEFAQKFIDKEVYDLLKLDKEAPELGDHEYGTRVKSAGFVETINVTKGLAPTNKIAKDKEEALQYLNYGYEAEKKSYTTKEYDTVKGIAWLHNISINHLMTLNKEVIVSENQLLKVGTILDITPLNSPIHFEVVYENQMEEQVYPSVAQVVYDDTLREGMENVDMKQVLGLENSRYEEVYVNGESIGEGKKIGSIITKQPIREVKRVGTKIFPNIGSGHFRWPVEVSSITCGWGCYYGHQATDVQNRYNFYGDVLASDRGVITENAYTDINGYYYIIDHNNGYTTYYGHMSNPGIFPVGTVVQQGEVIGRIGMTGFATGPHVHFEIRLDGKQIDPETMVGK